MKSAAFIVPAVALSLAVPAICQDDEKPKAVSQAQALKMGEEKLTTFLGNESEAGQDDAARLYAAAKRLETEAKLAQKDLRLVLQLNTLRNAVGQWDDAWCEAMSLMSGGGTMWAHMQSRNDVSLEKFLASLAPKMPLKDGQAPEALVKKWEAVKAKIEAAKLPKESEEAIEGAAAQWKQHREHMLKLWETLKWEISALSEPDAAALLKHVTPDAEELKNFGAE